MIPAELLADLKNFESLSENNQMETRAALLKFVGQYIRDYRRSYGVGAGSFQLPRYDTEELLFWIDKITQECGQ